MMCALNNVSQRAKRDYLLSTEHVRLCLTLRLMPRLKIGLRLRLRPRLKLRFRLRLRLRL